MKKIQVDHSLLRSNIVMGIDPSINSTGISVYNKIDNTYKYWLIVPEPSNKQKEKQKDFCEFVTYLYYQKFDKLQSKTISYEEKERMKVDNFIKICDYIKEIIIQNTPDVIVIEGVSYGSVGASLIDLAGLNFMLRYLINKMNITYFIISPQTTKKLATGKGNCKKIAVIESFYKENIEVEKLGIKKIDDLADAYFISRYLNV